MSNLRADYPTMVKHSLQTFFADKRRKKVRWSRDRNKQIMLSLENKDFSFLKPQTIEELLNKGESHSLGNPL